MPAKADMSQLPRTDAPARISIRTHRELRCVAALSGFSTADGRPVTMRGLIDLAWDVYKQQRPEIVELLRRIDVGQERP